MVRLMAVVVSALLALCAGNVYAQAAYVHAMTGSATTTTGATQRALRIGDLIESGSTVSTGDKSTAVIKFEDGQVMALAERSSFRIVDYRYDKQRVSQSSAVFSLLQGGLRFISGVIGATNRNNFRMTAGTATIGIRGTDGIVNYDSVTQAVIAAVNAGALEMTTPQGTQAIGPGNFSSVTPGQGPTAPQPTTQATEAVRQVLNNLTVQNVPINTPVVVQASALAAAAQANAAQLAAQAAANPGNAALQTAAQDAAKQAQDSLTTAVQAAQQAFDQAVKEGGATTPAPAASPPSDTTGTTGATDPGTSSTLTGAGAGAGAGGGGGGGGTTTCTSGASPC
jgi:hypothetical protein